ncbi:MAG TPA: hypothetical protein VFP50_03370 [Anaeromyxobacteraceae bacterium]|nr:hypothetical protein [Anaeromyxobacteraceae bacterium]
MRHAQLRRSLPFVLLAVATMGAGPCGTTKECSTDADCGYGKYCGAGSCQRYTWFCATPSVSMNDRGEWRDCGVYACDTSTGRCPSSSNSTLDCANGALWDAGSYTCVCPVGTPCGASDAPPAYDLSGYRTCSVDADCAAAEMCWRSPWVLSPRPICVSRNDACGFDATGAVSVAPSATLDAGGNLVRTTTSCGAYQCDPVSGQCLDYCVGTGDCQGSNACWLCVGDPTCNLSVNQTCVPTIR